MPERRRSKTRFTVVGRRPNGAQQRYTVSVRLGEDEEERELIAWARRRQRFFFVVALIALSAFVLYWAL